MTGNLTDFNFENMKQLINNLMGLFFVLLSPVIVSCNHTNSTPSSAIISQLNLKRGNVISCGPPDAQFGSVDFDMTCDVKSKKDFPAFAGFTISSGFRRRNSFRLLFVI